LQGLFELGGVAYVGSGVLASAVGMDKILMKTVFRAHGFPVADYVPVDRADWEEDPSSTLSRVEGAIGFPCFAKPASLGSSVGISKVRDRAGLADALDLAAQFGPRIVVERALDAREIECGVLGNRRPAASVVGEVIPSREFYDYEAKYHDPSTRFVIPANVDAGIAASIQSLAVRAFEAIGAAGLARVDFFLDRNDSRIYINEINTIPGFTSMSVFPRLWAASGISYRDLISQLIELACERHGDAARNRTRYEE
jgi:D-alanine-D-alanine ligase